MSLSKSQPKVTLFRGFKGSSAFTPSQFVSKLEARLRFAGMAYQNASEGPLKAPRGKIPFVDITAPNSTNGQPMKQGLADDLNAHLSPTMKAQDLAIRGLLEERLYWFECYERFVENYYAARSMVLWQFAYPVQVIIGLLVYRNMSATLHGQGTSRYTTAEIRAFRLDIWQNMDALLAESKKESKGDGDAPFWILGGVSPTEADTSMFGFIASALMCPAAPESRKIVSGLPNVMDYARRIHGRYFLDYTLGV